MTSTTMVSKTARIMESTCSPVVSSQHIQDRPRGLKEAETLAILKSDLESLIDLANVDDYLLLRFLRARSLHVSKAKELLVKYFEFRKTNVYMQDICRPLYTVPPLIFEGKVKFLKTVDHDGRPVMFINAGSIPVREIFKTLGKDEMIRFGHYYLEFLLSVSERQRKLHGHTKIVGITDLDGLSFRNVFFPHSVSTGIYATRTFETFYPELLHVGIFINANWVYHSAYKIVKPFMSDATVEKLQVYGHDTATWKPVLKKYLPESSIPVDYGGTGPPLEYATEDAFGGFQALH